MVAGLDQKTNEPYIATMDLIGCPMETKDFVVGGTCTEQLYGMCESLWNPDMVSRRIGASPLISGKRGDGNPDMVESPFGNQEQHLDVVITVSAPFS